MFKLIKNTTFALWNFCSWQYQLLTVLSNTYICYRNKTFINHLSNNDPFIGHGSYLVMPIIYLIVYIQITSYKISSLFPINFWDCYGYRLEVSRTLLIAIKRLIICSAYYILRLVRRNPGSVIYKSIPRILWTFLELSPLQQIYTIFLEMQS